jgi:hypothetical protein
MNTGERRFAFVPMAMCRKEEFRIPLEFIMTVCCKRREDEGPSTTLRGQWLLEGLRCG